MESPYRNRLEINQQRLRIVTRTASQLLAKMKELHELRKLLASAILGPVVSAASRTRTIPKSATAVRAGSPTKSTTSRVSSPAEMIRRFRSPPSSQSITKMSQSARVAGITRTRSEMHVTKPVASEPGRKSAQIGD